MMKTSGSCPRIPLVYKEWVPVPPRFAAYVWDPLDGKAPLEDLVHKVLVYGNFEDIREIYALYPQAVFHVALTYSDIHRGVRYWIKEWSREHGGGTP
uniref:Uncharacterized protein n=1 Tax=Desulfacinum infernum TaxID=35837 RepID=A0A832EJP5_9BACT